MYSSPRRKGQTFVCRYMYKGSEWGFELIAEDFDDAQARLFAVRQFGKVVGIKIVEIPAVLGVEWFVETVRLVRNFFLELEGMAR